MRRELGHGVAGEAVALDKDGALFGHRHVPGCLLYTSMFSALRQLFDPERKSSRTLVMVLDDAQVAVAREVINRVTGGLNQPDTVSYTHLPHSFSQLTASFFGVWCLGIRPVLL